MKSEPKQQQVSYNYLTFISIRANLSYITASVTLIKYLKGNSTLCEYYVTVCWYQKTMRSEFRKFINGKPTIQGFYLKVNQWSYLKRLQKYINLSIKETT